MDPRGRNNLRCPCYDLREEFQKIVDWKDSGLVIYRHTSQVEYGTKESEEIPTINNNEDKFVLHNTKNTDILSADIMVALDKYGISCPRCAYIIKNAKRMLEIVPKVKSNHVMGICDHCRKKLGTCIECNKVVKRYVTTRDESKDIKQCVKSYISNIHRLLTDVICEKKLFKDIRREVSDREMFSIHRNLPTSTQEPVIEDVFERQGIRSRLPRTSFDSTAVHSGLPKGKKRAVFFDSENNDVVETKYDHSYSRSLENLTYYDNKLLADDAIIRNDYEKSFSFGSDSSILKKYSKTGKISLVPDFRYKKSKIDNVTKRTIPNLKERNLSKSTPHIKKSESNDKSDQLSLRYHSEKDLINVVSNTMDDTVYSYFEYYFPKELDIKLKKPIKTISSSELISNTQNMLRDKAEKEKMRQEQDRIRKQEEKKRQILEKIEKKKEKKRLLVEEEARKRTEEDKKFAEEKNVIIIAEQQQVRALSSDDEERSSEKLKHLKGKKTQSKSIAQVKVEASEDYNEGKKRRKQSSEKVEKIKQKDDIESLEHKQASKKYEEYSSKKSKEGVDTTRKDKDGTKKEDKERKKFKDDNTMKKEKDKYESKRSKGDDDTIKPDKGETRKEDKYESSRSKGDDDTKRESKKSVIDETPIITDKQKHDDSVKNAKDTSKEIAGRDATDKQKDVKNAELTTKSSLAPKDKKEADTLEKKSALTEKQPGKDDKAAAEFNKLLVEQAKQNEIDRKQKQIQEEEEKKAIAAADKKLGESAKINSPQPKKTLTIIKTTNVKVSPPSSPAQKSKETTAKDLSFHPGKDDKAAAEFNKLLVEQAKQKEIDRKEKQIQEEEEKKAKADAEKKLGESAKINSPRPKKPLKITKATNIKVSPPSSPAHKSKETTAKDLSFKKIKMAEPSGDDLLLQLVKMHQSGPRKELMPKKDKNQLIKILARHGGHRSSKATSCKICTDSDIQLELDSIVNKREINEIANIIIGEKFFKYKVPAPVNDNNRGQQICDFQAAVEEDLETYNDDEILQVISEKMDSHMPIKVTTKGPKTVTAEQEPPKGIIRYALSDRSFIDKGWTLLPTEKVVRKMNVYRMRPAHPEFDWFEHNKSKRLMQYDSGEKLAEFDEKGRGRWFYKNGRVALDYYDAEETNAQQRFVIYSSGEPDERGRSRPFTILATFDYLGNGVVFDHGGKIRLKYNQTEGVVLDRAIGPVSHWKWHTLNDPPVLQQVMIDTQMPYKDPTILKLGRPDDNKPRADNEEMLAIEFDNFIKEKSKKLTQTFKPFQIKMKALKINEQFSLKVLDQATVYLIFRDGSANLKLNLGMILDHKEIVDTDTAEVGEVSNNLERLPARTDSIAGLQSSVAHAQHIERLRAERERRLRPKAPSESVDQLTAAASRPMRPPFRTAASDMSVNYVCKCRKPSSSNLYYDTRLV